MKNLNLKYKFFFLIISLISPFWIISNHYFFPYKTTLEIQAPQHESIQIHYSFNNSLKEETKNIHLPIEKSSELKNFSTVFTDKNIRLLTIDLNQDFNIKSIIVQNRFYQYVYTPSQFKNISVINPFPNFTNLIVWLIISIIIFFILSTLHYIILLIKKTIFFKKYKNYIYYSFLLINLIVSVYIIASPPETKIYISTFFSFIFLFTIPSYFLLLPLQKKLTSLEKLFLSLPIGISFYTLTLYLINQFHLKIYDWILYLFISLTTLLFLYFFFKRKEYLIYKKIPLKKLIYLWSIFNILLFIFIIPTKGLFVAPLHDPVANSIMSKFLIDSNFSEFIKSNLFYPPGASYITAIISKISNINTAKTVLITTNLFNLMTGFSFAFFIKSIFKKKHIFLISLIIFSLISSYVSGLYFNAGKNSQIIGYLFFFLSLGFFNYLTKNNTSFYYKFIFTLTLITSFLMHYNNIILYLYFLPVIFIFNLIKYKKISKKDILHWIILLSICVLIILQQISLIKISGYNLATISQNESFNIHRIFSLTNLFNFLQTKNIPENILIQKTGLIALFILIPAAFKNKFLFIFIGFPLFLYLIIIPKIPTISNYANLNIFMYKIFCITLLICILYKRLKNSHFLLILLFLISIPNLFSIYNQFINAKKLSVVTQADLNAYQWINQNIPSNKYFLPTSATCLTCPHEPYLLDGAMYLKVFTKSEDCITSWSGNYCSFFNKKYLDAYQKLIKDPNNTDITNIFTQDNISYIYNGSYKPWGNEGLDVNILLKYENIYSKIYDQNNVQIFKIKDQLPIN